MKFLLLCAVLFVSQVTCKAPVDLGNLFTQGIAKTFEGDLKAHMKNVQDVHNPLIAAFRQKGCEVPSKENMGLNPIVQRIQSCVSITELIGALEQTILSNYYIAEYYKGISFEAANKASVCLQNEDLSVVVTCLLKEANVYGEHLRRANNFLILNIDIAKYSVNNIVPSFNACFGTNLSSLKELLIAQTDRCKQTNLLL